MPISRRVVLQAPARIATGRLAGAQLRAKAAPVEIVASASPGEEPVTVDRRWYGTVGVYDVDWLTTPGFERLLDNLAASPGAFHGVRVFGAFTAGQPEAFLPESGGTVWTDPDTPIDFTATFDALAALTSRGLTPFVALGFFPPAVSPTPIQPPATWQRWTRLVRTFFAALAADPRFGKAAIADWWFEVWNEPNEGRFWSGTDEDFFALYRATSEAVDQAQRAAGVTIRLGGPAIAYKPQADPESGAPWMERFLRFIAADPALRCDFVSFHRKGTVGDDPPDPRRLYEAAAVTAEQALAIDPVRFAALTIVNDEADEKVGFEVPYAPRVTEQNAAWLGATAAIHAGLDARFRDAGVRFVAAADNANLQLVQSPFDGRRSLMTRATPDSGADLLKVPAYGFYELVRLLGDRQCAVTAGSELVFPHTDLYHLPTTGDGGVACLLAYYPHPGVANPPVRTVEYVVTDLPWPRINVARFRIDCRHSNAYTAAGGSDADPYPVPEPDRLPAVRLAQEVTLDRPIARDVATADGTHRETIALAPFATVCLWLTPFIAGAPRPPEWLEARAENGNAILRWCPNPEPFFYGYELFLLRDGVTAERLSPEPLRAAMWVDTAPPPGVRRYGVRAVSASGVVGENALSPDVPIVP